jgi:hypothetical protein
VSYDIKSPRPVFVEEEPKGTKIIYLGTKVAGSVLRITKEGIEINGYYDSFNEAGLKYATLREYAKIPWEDLEKMRESVLRKKTRTKVVVEETPDEIDKVDESYLKRLPIVTMNSKKFYIDVERRERRPVDSPMNVFKFRQIFGKEK